MNTCPTISSQSARTLYEKGLSSYTQLYQFSPHQMFNNTKPCRVDFITQWPLRARKHLAPTHHTMHGSRRRLADQSQTKARAQGPVSSFVPEIGQETDT